MPSTGERYAAGGPWAGRRGERSRRQGTNGHLLNSLLPPPREVRGPLPEAFSRAGGWPGPLTAGAWKLSAWGRGHKIGDRRERLPRIL